MTDQLVERFVRTCVAGVKAEVMKFKIGDLVRLRSEWENDPNGIPNGIPNQIPTGTVRKIEVWGSEGALYVDDERRAFAGYVFELDHARAHA